RPSKRMQTFRPFSTTDSWSLTNSTCRRASSRSYFFRFSLPLASGASFLASVLSISVIEPSHRLCLARGARGHFLDPVLENVTGLTLHNLADLLERFEVYSLHFARFSIQPFLRNSLSYVCKLGTRAGCRSALSAHLSASIWSRANTAQDALKRSFQLSSSSCPRNNTLLTGASRPLEKTSQLRTGPPTPAIP